MRLFPEFACLLLAPGAFAQRPPMPGVPGVQSPMSALIPDAQYAIKGSPDWLAITEDAVWVNSKPTDMIFRMDPKSNEVVASVPVKKPCSGFAVGAGTLWSPSCEEKVIYRIDLVTNKLLAKVPVGPANTEGGIAFGSGSAWMPSDPAGIVSRIDPATNKVVAQIKVPPDSFTAVYAYGLMWVSSTAKSVVSVIHPATNKVIAEVPVGPNPRFMAAGEGYVWTLNQGTGNVTKIDPYTKKVVATIEVGVPGTGGDIAAGEGAVWVSERTIPVSRIDPSSNKVTVQFCGPGGDALRVGHGSVWLSNGRLSTVWRFLPEKAAPHSWTRDAQKADLDGDGKPDILVEDLTTYIPGESVQFRMKLINPNLSGAFVLKTTLNGKKAETPFVRSDEEWVATFPGAPEPRWIHYSICAAAKCTPELVVASPTTSVAFATNKAKFVPDGFLAPEPPQVGSHKWHILEPQILKQDYQALMNMAGATGPKSITPDEDYGELKRHRWEFQRSTSFAYGIMSPDEKVEVACVYVNPSKKQGYDAMVRIWVTEQGAKEGLDSLLEAKVREWIKQKWPFQKVIYPGRDMTISQWNALKDATD